MKKSGCHYQADLSMKILLEEPSLEACPGGVCRGSLS